MLTVRVPRRLTNTAAAGPAYALINTERQAGQPSIDLSDRSRIGEESPGWTRCRCRVLLIFCVMLKIITYIYISLSCCFLSLPGSPLFFPLRSRWRSRENHIYVGHAVRAYDAVASIGSWSSAKKLNVYQPFLVGVFPLCVDVNW